MKIAKNRATATLIALSLALTIAASLALPIANAHTPAWQIPTHCYAVCTVNPVGVNQETGITFWLNAVPPTAFGAYGDRWKFTIEITKPDGTKETLGPLTSDPVGGGFTKYTPTQVGTYTIVAKFPDTKITGQPVPPGGIYFFGGDAYINDTYLASQSNPITLVAQEEQVQPWPDAPLPTQFWTRPINSLNRNWACLAANWLAGAAQNYPLGAAGGCTTSYSYGPGPESSHVMWSQPMWAGGIMDARFGDIGYYNYHYEGLGFQPPIILNGKLYYNVMSLPRIGWYCLDLYTGEVEYFQNTTGPVTGVGGGFDASGAIQGGKLAFGQIYDYESPNQHGGIPYLWSTTDDNGGLTTWRMYDAFTGKYICSIKNVPTSAGFFGATTWGTQVYGKDGSITHYNTVGSGANMRLQIWNTSRAIWYEPVYTSNNYWMWRPTYNMTFDGNNGYSLNVSIPAVQGTIRAIREGEIIIGGVGGKNNGTYVQQGHLWALSLKPGQEGTLLWNITFTPPQQATDAELLAGGLFGTGTMQGPTVSVENGVFLFNEVLGLRWWGYSLSTGQQLWGPTPSEPSLNFYGMQYNIYDGKLLTCGYGGVLIAYDIKTGKQLWNYTAANVGFESPYGNYPMGIGAIADGKIYIGAGEHSITQPPWRGPTLRCINASNGAELWKFPLLGVSMSSGNAGDNFAIADGYLVALNGYDNQIYCFGKGPSATTVTASPKVSVHGNSVVIEGTVTDQTPSTEAKGTPAISDEYMDDWMAYLYMQQGIPANAKGVDVSLDALDPNGNFVHIGTATSDMSGNYGLAFVPEVPGFYTIMATFAGSKSYYPSYAETFINVDEAPPATAPPVYPQPYDYTWHFIGTAIAIIIAVAVAVIVLIKKK
ncbi:MAG: PQQ-binding-like beta-propeller repeat protein [Candidatus Bathyarchaeota archaeon]|nr:PQQ-binding-like beta-propeller repeat protein [Candidatus Bathyarchaeota archaeon]